MSYYAKPRYSFIPESLYFYTQYREDAATNKDNCIQNDLTAYKYLCTTDEYKNISQKLKTATTNHILGGAIHYWRYAASEPLKQRYQKDIEEFLEYVKGQFGVLELTKMSNYRKLKHLLFKYRHKKFFDKFDIRTTDTEKTYVLFGKKFRVKRWTKVLREKLLKEGIVEKVDFEKRIINIVMILDEQYFYCTAVALSSMKRNKNKKNIYKIYLCHNNLNKKQLEYLESFKSSYFDIIFIDTAKYIEKYKNLSQYCHVTTTALIKFDLQDILKGLDKVLYLDVDIIANKDMSDIYNTDITDYYLAATREIIPEKRGWNKEVGTKYYFNSGVMLLNLTKMRTANLSKKMIEKKQNQPSGWKCQDQHIFNWAVNDNFKSLPITCNALVFLYQKKHITIKEINYFYNTDFKNFSDLLKKTYIIHFGGDGKPWIYYIPRYSRFYKKYSKYIKYSTQPKLKRYFDINRPLENIFSIRNSYSKSHKVITLIGIKLKIKRNIRSN